MKTMKVLILTICLIVIAAEHGECQTAYESYKNGVALLDQGMKANDQISVRSAISLFDAALEGLSNDLQRAGVYVKRAVAYGVLGQTDLAIQDFSACIELVPDNLFAKTSRGCMYASSGQMKSARRDFTSVCERDPSSDACKWKDAIDEGDTSEICNP